MSTAEPPSTASMVGNKAINPPDSGLVFPRRSWTQVVVGTMLVVLLAVGISIGVEHLIFEAGLDHEAISWLHATLGIIIVLAFSGLALSIMHRAVRDLEAFSASSLGRLGETIAHTTGQLTEAMAINNSLLDALQERILVVDREGTIIRANSTAREEAGTNPEGLAFADAYLCCDTNDERRSEKRLIEHAFATRSPFRGRLLRGGSDCKRLLSVDVYPVFDPSGKPKLVVEIARDVTEEKEAEVQTRHREKMIALGMLAAGIAHDLGNPLASLSSELELLERGCNDPAWRDPLKVLREHVERISRSLREMVEFARRRTETKQEVIVEEAIADALRLVRHGRRGKHINLKTEMARDLPPVNIRDDDLVLILVNLLINAFDAMPAGGTVMIEGSLSHAGEVLIRVSDTGIGMTDSVRTRATEALYTTKTGGSGLGLSTCADTLHCVGGRLELASGPNRGTTASIFLPVSEAVAAPSSAAVEDTAKP